MKPVCTFTVLPTLPQPLEPLRKIAYNMRWAWDQDSISLFRRLDPDLWETTSHNPVMMIGTIDQARLEASAADESFLAHLDRVARDLDEYMHAASTWFERNHTSGDKPLIAYFSAEFGLAECLSIFAGGLGLLAGDHLKSASDLGVPLVGVGLLYQRGYLRQRLNDSGWQEELYPENDFSMLPLTLERGSDGLPVTIEVALPGRSVKAQVWRVQVGRVPLYLLDTNIDDNDPADRDITDQLYGGDKELRIKQEILLGIGGFRVLEALGIEPAVYHVNEGHSAFLTLERARRLMQDNGVRFAEACEAAAAGTVFTSHTPVPAGHDYFPPSLMETYFGDYARSLGLSTWELLALGRQNPNNSGEEFCMTVLALRMAAKSNGVSALHGEVTRRMWQGIWPEVPEADIPIGHVTNGVHVCSWISQEMHYLYDRYLGPRWEQEPSDPKAWGGISHVPPEELWRTHERRRERLVAYARRRLRTQLERRGAPGAEIEAADEVLDLEALTIGFARRFAGYKRADLLLRDPERLARLLNNPDHPVQIIFAGKAHPRDDHGKGLIREVVSLARRPEFRRRIVFLEDYDPAMARYLVQGVDVWLNNPRRPQEASGTSGMKAAANGVLNVSTLDGWWDEAWRDCRDSGAPVGWAIGNGEVYSSDEYQDQVEAELLYGVLERDVVPTFYDRAADGLPRRWIDRVKSSVSQLCQYYNTHRMVRQYVEGYYLPAAERYGALAADSLARARALSTWKERLYRLWLQVRVEAVDLNSCRDISVGQTLHARAWLRLGDLAPEEVTAELYLGRVNGGGVLVDAQAVPMHFTGKEANGSLRFEATDVPCYRSGPHGCTVRVLPNHPDLSTHFLPGLITWAS
ncbi:MAG: alpha-glucan family phosphorylase [Anaerolineae bacterium]